ncbi:DinB family protein [Alteribacillus sp. JSM 102045]|uniref:DinB family protein n=1 Tax=Alteribacillus sp. JSM 102045 TaxID=1562101 RepID=UPI0035C096DA
MKNGEAYAKIVKEKLEFFPEQAAALSDEQVRWKPSEEEWSIMELLCHVEEFPLYFTKELENVVEKNAETWGRNMQHEGRLAAVAASENREVESVLKGIQETKDIAVKRLSKVSEKDLKIEKPHNIPKFGVKSMEFLVEHFLVEHLDTHQNQFQRIVSQYEKQKV